MSKFRSILPGNSGNSNNRRPSSSPREYGPSNRGSQNRTYNVNYGNPYSDRDSISSNNYRSRQSAERRSSRSKKNSQLPYYLILSLIIILIIWAGWRLIKTSKNLKEAEQKQISLEEEKKQLQSSVDELKNQLKLVNTDEFIEKYAHEKLGMIRPNEILVQTANGKYQINEAALQALNGGKVSSSENSEESESNSSDEGNNNNSGENTNQNNKGNKQNNKNSNKQNNKNNNSNNMEGN